ncbi:MAG: hypothetical protein AMJ81_12505, partial [Phycisphaerae bacterium SM23_33]
MGEPSTPAAPDASVVRAIKLSYVQAMLGAVYAASTGGMFLIGYALKLGAGNVQIGLLSTIPMLCVVMQLLASAAVERGVSRRRMTVVGSLLNVSGWALIILIPYAMAAATGEARVAALIAIVALVTLFWHVAGNARGSWLGNLVPAGFRGTFFGRTTMFWGIIGTGFAIAEGFFLDRVKGMGVGAFGWLFGFGMVFGLASALLFLPQPELPLARQESPLRFRSMVGRTFANGPLMMVMLYAVLWSMQGIAGPFYATYLLRDLKMPFLHLGLLNAAYMLTLLAFSPFWGRMADRYGCRPVLIFCAAVLAPLPLVWVWLTDVRWVYLAIPPINLLAGFAAGGVAVGLSTLVYKVTPDAGRSVQLAIYSILVV